MISGPMPSPGRRTIFGATRPDVTLHAMEPRAGEWPAERWRLTAPESYVLRAPEHMSSVEAFKLGLREVVLRRGLRIERLEIASPFGRSRPKVALRQGTVAMTEPALTPLVELYARALRRRSADYVLVEDLARGASREFKRSFAGYIDDHVYPSLARRGLLYVDRSTRFGLFPQTRHRFTPAGREAAAELNQWLRVGTARLERWVRDFPDRALAYAGGAGAAILLMDHLFPEFERLGRHILTRGEGASADGLVHEGGSDESEFDFSVFGGDAGGGFEGGFDTFGELDAAVDVGGDVGGGGGGNGGGG
jgi:hypothetical protein